MPGASSPASGTSCQREDCHKLAGVARAKDELSTLHEATCSPGWPRSCRTREPATSESPPSCSTVGIGTIIVERDRLVAGVSEAL